MRMSSNLMFKLSIYLYRYELRDKQSKLRLTLIRVLIRRKAGVTGWGAARAAEPEWSNITMHALNLQAHGKVP